MTFKWQGRTYDTAGMNIFETDNPARPVIYVVPGGEVFIVEIERLEGIEIRLAERDEAQMLAERWGFSALLESKALSVSPSNALPAGQHALIVEDDGVSRHALGRLLNRSGYETACAATVAEAETKLDQLPTWLILDLHLPDGNGTTILERIRTQNLPIKIAITTGETDQATLSKVWQLRPDAIFHKPLDISKVMHWLDAA